MKRFTMAVLLACLLSASALAGDIPCGVTSPPPPPPPDNSLAKSPPSPGDIPTGGFAEEAANAALDGLIGLVGLLT